MSTVPPPISREVQEFSFKLFTRIRLFEENEAPPLKETLQLLVAAPKFGLVFVGTPSGFDVLQTTTIVTECEGANKPSVVNSNFPTRKVFLEARSTHLDVSCDSNFLAVSFPTAAGVVLRVYNVPSFTGQNEEVVSEIRLSAGVQALAWNPGSANMLATCLTDGSAYVYKFKNSSFEINSIPPEAQATCMCWSPKGKQIVIGSKSGFLNQFKPDLKIVKAILPPKEGVGVVSVQWLSNLEYAVVYTAEDSTPFLMIVNTPRNLPITYINYDDITYSNGNNRVAQFYFIHQQTWNVLMVASSNSMEVGLLGLQGADWEQWIQEDSSRAELPFSASKKESHPVGMVLDTSPVYNLAYGETELLPAMPFLLLLSHEGILSVFWTINLMYGSSICEPPSLVDTSGLHLFTAPQASLQSVAPPSPTSSVTPPKAAAVPMGTVISAPAAALPTATVMPQSPVCTPPKSFAAFSVSSFTQPTPITPPPPNLLNKSGAFVAPLPQPGNVTPQPGNVTPEPDLPEITVVPTQPVSFTPQSFSLIPQTGTPEPSTRPTLPQQLECPTTLDLGTKEESQELKAMSDALMENLIKEETLNFSQEMDQLKQRHKLININIINDRELDKLSDDIYNWAQFINELGEKTKVQSYEVKSVRNFLLDVSMYVENMKTRLQIEKNPDYLSLRAADTKDPIVARKIKEMKSNIQVIEYQLANIDSKICTKWNWFQETSKENREAMQIPALEAVYQSMVTQNIVLMRQKAIVEDLESKIKTHQRAKLMSMLNISRMMDGHSDNRVSELSHILQEFLSLSLNNSIITATSELEESLSNLLLKESSTSTGVQENILRLGSVVAPKTIDNSVKCSSLQKSVLPIVTVSPGAGSISSGQPVPQTSTPTMETMQHPAIKYAHQQNQNSLYGDSTPSLNSSSLAFGANLFQSNTASSLQASTNPSMMRSSMPSSGVIPQNTSKSDSIPTATKVQYNFGSGPSNILLTNASKCTVPLTTNSATGFSFAPQALASTEFSVSAQATAVSSVPTLSKSLGFNFCTPEETTTRSTNTSIGVSKSSISYAENLTKNKESASTLTGNNNPLVSLNCLVSGIEPAKVNDQNVLPKDATFGSNSFSRVTDIQQFSNFTERRSIDKEQNTFGMGLVKPNVGPTNVTQLSGASSAQDPATTNLFGSVKTEKSPDMSAYYERISPVLEINLQSDTQQETKSSFEHFAKSKDIVITRVNRTPTTVESIGSSELNLSAGLFSSFVTPTKTSKNEFGGSIPEHRFPMYEIQKPKVIFESITAKNEKRYIDDLSNQQETSITQKDGKDSLKSKQVSESSFSFYLPSLQDNTLQDQGNKTFQTKQDQGNKILQSSLLHFGKDLSRPVAEVTEVSSNCPNASNKTITPFSSSQVTHPSSTSFTFAMPATSAPASISTFSFGSKPLAPSSIFGGQSVKVGTSTPLPSSSIFGSQSTIAKTIAQANTTLSLFGGQSSMGENATSVTTKSTFGTQSATSETTTTAAPSSVFGNQLTNVMPSSFFGAQFKIPENTVVTSSIFGGKSTTVKANMPVSCSISFGVPSPTITFTSATTSSNFGRQPTTAVTATSVATASVFGGPQPKSGVTTTSSATQSIFGTQNTTAITSTSALTSSIFGGPSTTAITTNLAATSSILGNETTIAVPTTSVLKSSVFGGAEAKTAVTTTSADIKNILGAESTPTVSTTSVAASVVFRSQPTITVTNSSVATSSVFGGTQSKTTVTTSSGTSNIFGTQPTTAVSKTSAAVSSIFGSQPTTAATSTSAGSSSIFGSQSTATSATKTEPTNVFGPSTPSTEVKSIFAQTPVTVQKNLFGQSTTNAEESTNLFSQQPPLPASTSVFGQTGSGNLFGQSTGTDNKNAFIQPSSAQESKNGFGQTSDATASLQSAFSFSLSTTTSAQSSSFGSPATTATSFFGQSVCSPANSPFGQTSTSAFGTVSQSPFGQSTFGQSGGSLFGQSSFGANNSFGGGATSVFGGGIGPAFSQSQGGQTSMFGGGAFSGGGQSVSQSGFGTATFQNKPAFGACNQPAFGTSPAFGAAPTFGGSASFGSPPKLFGSPNTTSPSGFGSPEQQQSSTFGNLANQNTMSFGNLAQNQTQPAFGSGFSSVQQNSSPPAFSPTASGSMFGGSSFSSWR